MTKLCNVLLTRGITEKGRPHGNTANCLYLGVVATDIADKMA